MQTQKLVFSHLQVKAKSVIFFFLDHEAQFVPGHGQCQIAGLKCPWHYELSNICTWLSDNATVITVHIGKTESILFGLSSVDQVWRQCSHDRCRVIVTTAHY